MYKSDHYNSANWYVQLLLTLRELSVVDTRKPLKKIDKIHIA